jgi:hypothetical protein
MINAKNADPAKRIDNIIVRLNTNFSKPLRV